MSTILSANDAFARTKNIEQKKLNDRMNAIMLCITEVSDAGKFSMPFPFPLRASEIHQLEKLNYEVDEDAETIGWEVDLFSEEDMKDAFS